MTEEKQTTEQSGKGLDRRDFIQGLATVPVLGVFGAAVYKQSQQGKVKKQTVTKAANVSDLNVAILGAGAQGQVLLNAMERIPGLRFKAVCDIWEAYSQKRVYRRLEQKGHDLNAYVDYEEMLAKEKDLDAVIIATPDFWHSKHTVDCLNAGINVYCEKEMSNTLEGARKMVEAAHSTGKLLQIGHQRRSNPRYIHCYDKIIQEAGMLGRITSANGQWNRSVQPDLGYIKKLAIDDATLKKYGFDSMHQFRNWRWYKGLGGGPIVDLGSHQIDIYSWFLGANPKSVIASGGTDYYDKATHEWYDTVMCIFEYETKQGMVRAYYQTLTTNSSEGYFENFLGDQGTLNISESASRGSVYREPGAPAWDEWINKGYITATVKSAAEGSGALDARETAKAEKHDIPLSFTDPYHQPHLENFFNSIRGDDTLNCPAEIGYETAVSVLKVNEAVETGEKKFFKDGEFEV